MKTITAVKFPYNERTDIKQTGYETLTEVIQELTRKGYTHDFNVIAHQDCLVCHKSELTLSPDEFQIDATFRFEGDTDPGDEMILFAISSPKHNIKGIVVNAFGIYADSDSSLIVEKLLEKSKIKKPIKRHKALTQLSRDHHFGLLLTWKIRNGLKNLVETERISKYIQFYFDEDLREHFLEEEEKLFPKIAEDNPLYQQVMNEHKRIYEMIEEIKTDKTNEDELKAFANLLEKHIRFEERTLFNYLQARLSAEELDSLYCGNNNKENIDDKWSDHFWNYKK